MGISYLKMYFRDVCYIIDLILSALVFQIGSMIANTKFLEAQMTESPVHFLG